MGSASVIVVVPTPVVPLLIWMDRAGGRPLPVPRMSIISSDEEDEAEAEEEDEEEEAEVVESSFCRFGSGTSDVGVEEGTSGVMEEKVRLRETVEEEEEEVEVSVEGADCMTPMDNTSRLVRLGSINSLEKKESTTRSRNDMGLVSLTLPSNTILTSRRHLGKLE
jgi:hypothetical protein